jgi:hypothetical protein
MTDDPEEKSKGTFSRLMKDNDHEAEPAARTNGRTSEPTDDSTDVRASERTYVRNKSKPRHSPETTYRIVVPRKRRRVRWAFDIFEDQLAAIDTLQFATVQQGQKKPTSGIIVQQALDAFIRREAKRLPTVAVEVEEGTDEA